MPHLEYAAQVWNPNLQGQIERIERLLAKDTSLRGHATGL